jgi:hypothetical protein
LSAIDAAIQSANISTQLAAHLQTFISAAQSPIQPANDAAQHTTVLSADDAAIRSAFGTAIHPTYNEFLK